MGPKRLSAVQRCSPRPIRRPAAAAAHRVSSHQPARRSQPQRCHRRRPPPPQGSGRVRLVRSACCTSDGALSCAVCGLSKSDVPQDCRRCGGRFARELRRLPSAPSSAWDINDCFVDLTPQSLEMVPSEVAGDSPKNIYSEWRQEIFRTPLVSLTYETLLPALWSAGLRDKGIEDEKRQVLSCFRNITGTVADISCGTGLMARALTASKKFESVVAIDFSENMLRQVIAGAAREGLSKPELQVIRGDVMSLPMVDSSCDAVYAGAAMHCWPDALAAVREIYRVMKPGARLYATTFLRPFPDVVFRFFTVEELEGIMRDAGFKQQKLHVQGRGVYGIITAEK